MFGARHQPVFRLTMNKNLTYLFCISFLTLILRFLLSTYKFLFLSLRLTDFEGLRRERERERVQNGRDEEYANGCDWSFVSVSCIFCLHCHLQQSFDDQSWLPFWYFTLYKYGLIESFNQCDNICCKYYLYQNRLFVS